MADEKLLSKLSINGSQYVIKDSIARENIASISGLAFNGAESLSGQIADLKAHGADSALSGVNHVQEQLNSLSGLALDGATSLSGAIAALETKEAGDVVSLSGSIETLKTKEQNDVNSLSGSIETLSGLLVSTISGLDAEVAASGTFVSVKVTEENGKITAVTVTENDIAKASDLTTETSNRETEDANLATAISGVQTNLNNAISGMYVKDTAVAGEFITYVDQVDGKIEVHRGGVSADHVGITEISGVSGVSGTATNVQSALEIIENQVSAFAQGAAITVSGVSSSASGVLKTYTIYQGSNVAGTIDIPKDLVVTGGEVIVEASDGEHATGTKAGEKVLKLTIANQTNPVYIPVKDLTDIYKGVSGSEIITNVNASNGIEASLVTGSITKDKLATAVQTSLGKADTSIQSVNGIPATHGGTGFNNGDINIYGTDIKRTDSDNTTIQSALTTIEGSVSAIDTRVSGLEAWKEGITVTYHTTSEMLSISGLVGTIGEVND